MIELAKSWLAYYICLFILLNTEMISFTLFFEYFFEVIQTGFDSNSDNNSERALLTA